MVRSHERLAANRIKLLRRSGMFIALAQVNFRRSRGAEAHAPEEHYVYSLFQNKGYALQRSAMCFGIRITYRS